MLVKTSVVSSLQRESLIVLFSLVVAVPKQLPSTNDKRLMSCDNYVITLSKTKLVTLLRGNVT